MKIIAIDNFDREQYADVLICENVNKNYSKFIVDSLNSKYGGDYAMYFFKEVEDDYKLWRGIEELI